VIRGYPARPSVAPGERLTLHVSTDAPQFRVVFHRWWDGFERVHESDWLPGEHAPDGVAHEDWQWPAYAFDIGRDWPSGVYIAHLLESAAPLPLRIAMEQAAALFVVRGGGRCPIVYKLPIATYHAYNVTGGACFYFQPPYSQTAMPPGTRLSWHRPGGGIGGETFGALDAYDASSPRQTFAHWDARFIRWMAQQGIECDFCADIDVHDTPELLQRHRLLLSVGHDEYWTEAMRNGVEAFVRGGGNAAFFGANLCWWRIHLVEGGRAMVCHQGGPRGAYDHWWPETGVHRPEDRLFGVSYRHGGGWWDGPRETEGYIVQQPQHWVFEGTGLRQGDCFGAGTSPPLVGYECDGAPVVLADATQRRYELAPWAAACGTPPDFEVLAVAPLAGAWQELPPREGLGPREGVHSATLGLHRPGGTVFVAGTTDWAQVLAQGGEPAVETITRNVVHRLAEDVRVFPSADSAL
jgi:hypothetical protein